MSFVGLGLLFFSAFASLTSGMPLFAILLVASVAGAGLAFLYLPEQAALLAALPQRLVLLLESDLLQAIPLFAFMGILLTRVPVIGLFFRAARQSAFSGRSTGPLAIFLSALMAPMNGSVAASVMSLCKSLKPELQASGFHTPQAQVLVAVGGVLGVLIPPSLVLLLLSDAMMVAHTTALNAARRLDRVINTQDIFHGTLLPVCLVITLSAVIAFLQWRGKRVEERASHPLTWREKLVAVMPPLVVLILLGGVSLGYFYAVEAAAFGAVLLLAFALSTGVVKWREMGGLVQSAFATTGALFALLMAATTFTLVLRVLGTDILLRDWVGALPAPAATLALGLGIVGVSAIVFDAVEIIYVIIPLVAPVMLERLPDAVWIAVLLLLVLQMSFLLPPLGLSVLLARENGGANSSYPAFLRALAPYFGALVFVFCLTLAWPQIVHPERLLARRDPTPEVPSTEDGFRSLPLPDEPLQIQIR